MSCKVAFACLTLLVAGCASNPPRELLDARAAYRRAAAGETARINPAQLQSAKTALQLAEQTFEDEGPDSYKTRDRAYVALRKAEIAETEARAAMLDRATAQSMRQVQLSQAQVQAQTKEQLQRTQEQLQQEQARLEEERRAREDAEKRAQQAAQDLQQMAHVKQEQRGMVITLPGNVLFASNKSELLPASSRRLDEVAKVIAKQPAQLKILVVGHTDATGSDETNKVLSQKRADSVRDYLVSHGVPRDRITSEGHGEAEPIADNKTAEGRATNRRVEIIVLSANGGPSSTAPSGRQQHPQQQVQQQQQQLKHPTPPHPQHPPMPQQQTPVPNEPPSQK
jgi:outer membrane protein OmpA-like peptidoglycan-associated protein